MSDEFGTYAPNAKLTRLIEKAREWSFKKGFKYPSSYCRRRALKLIGSRPVDYEFRGGRARFFPNGNTAEKRALLNPARFDPVELAFISENLPRGGTFLDIGANVGFFSIVAAQAAGPEGTVLAVEPNPPVHRRLVTNIVLNQRGSGAEIVPLQLAITDRAGPIDFLDPDGNLGEGRIVTKDIESGRGTVISVEGKPLPAVLAEHKIISVDMIKIDIEGHELAALSPYLMNSDRESLPEYIIIERGSDEHWSELKALLMPRIIGLFVRHA